MPFYKGDSFTSGRSCVRVAHDPGRDTYTEGRECVIEELLIHIWVKITHKEIGTNVKCFLITRSLVHSDRLTVELVKINKD